MRTSSKAHITWRTAIVDRASVRYQVVQVAGTQNGEPLVLVHGLAGSTYWWRRNVPALAARHTLYLLDLPGFGGMRRHYQRFAVAHMADWITRWMDAVGLESAHFAAHSMGGLICLRLAAAHPQMVRRLALFAPAGVPAQNRGASVVRSIMPLLQTALYARPSFLPILTYDSLRTGPRMLLRAGSQILALDVREDLRRVRAPVLLCWGERDPLVPPEGGLVMRAALPDARLVRLPRAGHIAMYDRADLCNPLLLRFFAGEDVASGALSSLLYG
jgi:pimeloyl-ACP methyl ester carboxylesterase